MASSAGDASGQKSRDGDGAVFDSTYLDSAPRPTRQRPPSHRGRSRHSSHGNKSRSNRFSALDDDDVDGFGHGFGRDGGASGFVGVGVHNSRHNRARGSRSDGRESFGESFSRDRDYGHDDRDPDPDSHSVQLQGSHPTPWSNVSPTQGLQLRSAPRDTAFLDSRDVRLKKSDCMNLSYRDFEKARDNATRAPDDKYLIGLLEFDKILDPKSYESSSHLASYVSDHQQSLAKLQERALAYDLTDTVKVYSTFDLNSPHLVGQCHDLFSDHDMFVLDEVVAWQEWLYYWAPFRANGSCS